MLTIHWYNIVIADHGSIKIKCSSSCNLPVLPLKHPVAIIFVHFVLILPFSSNLPLIFPLSPLLNNFPTFFSLPLFIFFIQNDIRQYCYSRGGTIFSKTCTSEPGVFSYRVALIDVYPVWGRYGGSIVAHQTAVLMPLVWIRPLLSLRQTVFQVGCHLARIMIGRPLDRWQRRKTIWNLNIFTLFLRY